jgi:glucose-6-phosphate 1-dehydrogenase
MLRFGAKVPGLRPDIRSVTMDFTYGSAFNVDSPDAYETLILDALQGDASLFTRADEVEEAWTIVDPVISGWADLPAPDFPNYDAGTWGPDEADKLPARDGRRWRRF